MRAVSSRKLASNRWYSSGGARPLECDVDLAGQYGQWGAQLVRRVGGELPLAAEGSVEPIQHAVERGRQAADLVATPAKVQPARQVLRVDSRRGAGDAVDRTERPAGQKQSAGAGEHQRQRNRHRHEHRQLVEGGVDVALGASYLEDSDECTVGHDRRR